MNMVAYREFGNSRKGCSISICGNKGWLLKGWSNIPGEISGWTALVTGYSVDSAFMAQVYKLPAEQLWDWVCQMIVDVIDASDNVIILNPGVEVKEIRL